MEQADSLQLVILGGRAYHVTDFNRRTVRQDHYLMKWLSQSGGDKILPEATEDSTAFVVRLSAVITHSGYGPHLVAGLLLPEGKTQSEWTPDLAASTTAAIQQLATHEDREVVSDLCVQIAFNYFRESLEKLARAKAYEAMTERTLNNEVSH